ncbi:unnamed protein product [Prorocentrum cordatum]|uniref:Uncharacterized protein n=1 Tax=Prorocentrum cordatum TaxID=2364126 RepID=A0ABN9U6V2_9DINO|nr:unnamed protein product [Polarella glacialis]
MGGEARERATTRPRPRTGARAPTARRRPGRGRATGALAGPAAAARGRAQGSRLGMASAGARRRRPTNTLRARRAVRREGRRGAGLACTPGAREGRGGGGGRGRGGGGRARRESRERSRRVRNGKGRCLPVASPWSTPTRTPRPARWSSGRRGGGGMVNTSKTSFPSYPHRLPHNLWYMPEKPVSHCLLTTWQSDKK